MSTGIYFFTGTGNSLVVARDIAAKTGGSLILIASLTGSGRITPPYEPEVDILEIMQQKQIVAM